MTALLLSLSLAHASGAAPAEAPDPIAPDAGEAPITEEAEEVDASLATEEGPGEAEEPAEPAEPEYVIRFPGQVPADYRHMDLEQLYVDGRHDEVLKLAKARLETSPEDADLYWHVARAMFEKAEGFERDDPSIDKEAWYAEMASWAERGLAHAPDDPHLRFARGIANGRLGTTRGVLSSLFMAKSIEADWGFAAESGFRYSSLDGNEMLPCDAFLTLGIFYRLVPDWWIVQVLAGTRGDLDKSLDYLKRADSCGANRIGTIKELGVTQLCIGTKRNDDAMLAAGKATVQRYMKLPPVGNADEIDLKHGPLLLADPSIACEYSRDGQQDLNKGKLDEE